jgi:hypothetical protein
MFWIIISKKLYISEKSLTYVIGFIPSGTQVCTEIAIILGMVQFTIRGGLLRYKRYDAQVVCS